MRFGNRHLTAKISAMQEAAARQDSMGNTLVEDGDSSDKKKGKGFSVFSAMADKLVCSAITPAEESSSSGREYALESCESSSQAAPTKSKRLNVTFSPMKTCDCDTEPNAENGDAAPKQEDCVNNTKSPKSKLKNLKPTSEANGCDKCAVNRVDSMDAANDASSKSCDKSSEQSDPESGKCQATVDNTSPNNTSGKSGRTPIKSGHARTHAIVINLDDKSRFTEEVTV